MILSKYPFLVQKEIIDNMNHLDLLRLSFVSKNLKKLIMSSQKKTSKSIRSIEYQYDRADGTCVVYLIDESKPLEKYHRRSARTEDDVIMKILKLDEDKNDNNVQFNVLGKMIDFRFSDDYKYPIASYHEWDKELVFESIHNLFLDVFGNATEYNWEEPDWEKSEEFFVSFIPKLKNVSFCIGMYLDGHFSDVRNFENFFSSCPVAKTILLNVNKKMKPLSPESKFFDAESVFIDTHRINSPDFVRHFRGRQIILGGNRYRKSKLIDIVNRWKSGEAFQNLEYAEISGCCEIRFQHLVLNEIGAKFIDANRQPPTHTVRSLVDWYDRNYTTYPLISHRYIVRETDNRVASVFMMGGAFFIGVWDKTEEEFLKMVE
ncbi:hypothetical protein B9Z55_000768 [Caenorhabditis nigoni]|uniref:F-box domain-containing protein n=2 Tax=Caenorhabditis nigoni TaxID=1611254 RepID=A0A2G5VUQ2_9PELO|nr:hypothetical protein B9Z55_000768 [Caenorhabditis nigoni]